MISVVCVYSNEKTLRGILLKSLENQTVKFELITLDNVDNKYKSAAEVLNYGASQSNGKYVVFIHQDVELPSDSWLEDVEEILESIPDLGAAGVAGMSEKGRNFRERRRGFNSDFGAIWQWSDPVQKPEEVQILDEGILIVPNSVFAKLQFDEEIFDGWHCYAADYCLCISQLGLKSYVIPAFVYHRSLGINVENLLRYQKRLYDKHKKNYRRIYATTGEISSLKLRSYLVIKVLSQLYKRLFPEWSEHLRKHLADCDRVLDLGCGYNSPLQCCNAPFSVGIELFDPYLDESKRRGIHSQYIKADIRQIEFKPRSFDAVIAVDVLEYLTKQEGAKLLSKMEQWARKKVVITAPNGYLWKDGYDKNPLQEHRSGWSVEELRKLEYKVFGISGWKRLRGYRGSIKYEPSFLWGRISDLTQEITYYLPGLAFELIAIKKIDECYGQ